MGILDLSLEELFHIGKYLNFRDLWALSATCYRFRGLWRDKVLTSKVFARELPVVSSHLVVWGELLNRYMFSDRSIKTIEDLLDLPGMYWVLLSMSSNLEEAERLAKLHSSPTFLKYPLEVMMLQLIYMWDDNDVGNLLRFLPKEPQSPDPELALYKEPYMTDGTALLVQIRWKAIQVCREDKETLPHTAYWGYELATKASDYRIIYRSLVLLVGCAPFVESFKFISVEKFIEEHILPFIQKFSDDRLIIETLWHLVNGDGFQSYKVSQEIWNKLFDSLFRAIISFPLIEYTHGLEVSREFDLYLSSEVMDKIKVSEINYFISGAVEQCLQADGVHKNLWIVLVANSILFYKTSCWDNYTIFLQPQVHVKTQRLIISYLSASFDVGVIGVPMEVSTLVRTRCQEIMEKDPQDNVIAGFYNRYWALENN